MNPYDLLDWRDLSEAEKRECVLHDCREAHKDATEIMHQWEARGDEWKSWIWQKERERLAGIYRHVQDDVTGWLRGKKPPLHT